jgi:hypothetical protein
MTFPNDSNRPSGQYQYDDGRSSFVGISIGAILVVALIIGALVWNASPSSTISADNSRAATGSTMNPVAPVPPAPTPTPAPATPPNG